MFLIILTHLIIVPSSSTTILYARKVSPGLTASQQIPASLSLLGCCIAFFRCQKVFTSYILRPPVCYNSGGKAPHTLPLLFHNRRNSTDSASVVLYNWFRCLTVHERMPLWALSLTPPFWSSGHTINMLFIIQKALIMDTFDQITHSRRNLKRDSTIWCSFFKKGSYITGQ